MGCVLLASTLLSCSSESSSVAGRPGQGTPGVGRVEFHLTLPNGEEVDTIDLQLACSGIDQHHSIDVANGVAAFGGLTPGACHVEMSTQSDEGTDCLGEEDFTIVADQTVPVTVTLMC